MKISTKKEKGAKTKGRPVETDAADGNPRKQDSHSGLKKPLAFSQFPTARATIYHQPRNLRSVATKFVSLEGFVPSGCR